MILIPVLWWAVSVKQVCDGKSRNRRQHRHHWLPPAGHLAGEMGRTPHTPKVHAGAGRDHHVDGYSIFFAGGGFRGGMDYGATDEFGNSVVENAVDIHDVHATILHQMGIDHETLTFRYGGRDHRLTDVHGRVMKDWLV